MIKRETPADKLNACLKAFYLWRYVKQLTLSINIRVVLSGDESAGLFTEKLLLIGERKFPIITGMHNVKLTADFCNIVPQVDQLLEKVFSKIISNFSNYQ